MSQPEPGQPDHQGDTTNQNSGGVNLSNSSARDINYNDYRNATINNYLPAAPRLVCPQPSAPTDKVAGRDAELALLKDRLKGQQAVAIEAVGGLGGIGKTTLAHRLAYDLYHELGPERCFRAVLWLDITRLPEETDLLRKLAYQVEPEFKAIEGETLPQLRQRVRASLQTAIEGQCAECGPNRVLFVLDDVWENGLPIARSLQELRPPNSTLLVTTRFGTVARDLYAETFSLTRFQPAEGAKMLAVYLPDVTEADRLELARVLGGHALALKLAARRLPTLNRAKALQAQLDQYRTALAAGTTFADLKLADKTTDLETVLAYTYTDLDETAQSRFRALGVLAADQSFDKWLLAALWQLDDEAAVEAQVEAFYQLALLDLSDQEAKAGVADVPNWYRLHPLLHSYALALLKANAAEFAATRDRYHDCVIGVAQGFEKLPPQDWKEQLDPYLPHIEATGTALVAAVAEFAIPELILRRALTFARNIRGYLFRRREMRHDDWLEMGLAVSCRLKEKEGESAFLSDLGLLYRDLGEQEKALDYYSQSLVIDRALGNRDGEATTLHNIGLVYSDLGKKDKALTYYEQALPLARTIGDQSGEASIFTNIGAIYVALGEQNKALNYLEQALPLRRAVDDRVGEAQTLTNMGVVYLKLGEKDKALDYLEQALPLRRAVGDLNGEATTLNNMGWVCWSQNKRQEAIELLKQAATLWREVRSPKVQLAEKDLTYMREEMQADGGPG